MPFSSSAGTALTLGDLEDIRHYAYQAEKQGRARRIAARSGNDYMIDQALSKAVNKVMYDELERLAQAAGKPAGYIRNIKSVQSNIYDLMDALDPASTAALENESFRRGTDFLQRMNVTAALHPDTMSGVASVHGLKDGFVGSPKDMKSINNKIRKSFAQVGVPNTKLGKATQATANITKKFGKPVAIGSISDRSDDLVDEPPPAPTASRPNRTGIVGATVVPPTLNRTGIQP